MSEASSQPMNICKNNAMFIQESIELLLGVFLFLILGSIKLKPYMNSFYAHINFCFYSHLKSFVMQINNNVHKNI